MTKGSHSVDAYSLIVDPGLAKNIATEAPIERDDLIALPMEALSE
jgi:hypothetical protein